MINVINGRTINELVYNAINKIITEGDRTPSRNGDISAIYNAFSQLENPRARHLQLEGRRNNIFATIAETFWVFAGDDKIDPFLSFFLPRAKDFSDDGETWRSAYGPRLFGVNEALNDLLQQFKNEGIFTRRAVMSIFDPSLDTQVNLESKYGLTSTKDRSCNLLIDFFVTHDKKLHMNLKQRSGDVLWGFGSINIFEFTLLQECVLNILKRHIDDELTLGTYNHLTTNLHLYDFSGAQGYSVLDNKFKQRLTVQNHQAVFTPTDPEDFIQFNKDIVEILTDGILNDISFNDLIEKGKELFYSYSLKTNNLYFKYYEVVCAFLVSKKMKNNGVSVETINEKIIVDLSSSDEEFKQSIEKSSFRYFGVKGE